MMLDPKAQHKVWLHIGMPKTGTTAIQTVCFNNRKQLLEHGYLYPDFGHFQHQALVRELSRRAGSRVDFSFPGNCGPYPVYTDFLEQHKEIYPHTSIISSELFFQRPGSPPGMQKKQGEEDFEILEKTIVETAKYFAGCDVKILVYLRRQDNWLMSMYNETIKISGYAKDFDTFSARTIGTRFFRIIQMWIKYFGRKNVICHSYDSLMRNKSDSIDHFLETVCPEVPRDILNRTKIEKNPGLSNESLWIKQQINKISEEDEQAGKKRTRKEIKLLLDEITRSSLEPGRPMLSNAQRRSLMEKFLPGNQRLIRGLGYSGLQALIDLSDLEAAPADGTQLSSLPHETYRLAVEKMIKSLL